MKRQLWVLGLLFLVPTASAVGQTLTNSPHDFTSDNTLSGSGYSIYLRTDGNLCGTCHIPHTSADSQATAPLWGHATTTQTFTPYDSPTLDGAITTPASVSRACLSCHDGVTAVTGTQVINGGVDAVNSLADFGLNLQADHPVSVVYGTDAALEAKDANGNVNIDGTRYLPLYGTGATATVECGSCHNPHDWTTYAATTTSPNNDAFLRDDQITMCTRCHDKG